MKLVNVISFLEPGTERMYKGGIKFHCTLRKVIEDKEECHTVRL